MSLPHILNSEAGRNHYDPYHNNLFEVYFTLPTALQEKYHQDCALITEHVQSISGLDGLTRGPEAITQKFMGTTRTYLAPKLGDTSFEISVTLSLNLRNGVDNYIFKLFRDWNKLGYDLETGETRLKSEYVADWLKISIGNRKGDIIREVIFKDIILADGFTGLDELSYDNNDALTISLKFKSDWAQELVA